MSRTTKTPGLWLFLKSHWRSNAVYRARISPSSVNSSGSLARTSAVVTTRRSLTHLNRRSRAPCREGARTSAAAVTQTGPALRPAVARSIYSRCGLTLSADCAEHVICNCVCNSHRLDGVFAQLVRRGHVQMGQMRTAAAPHNLDQTLVSDAAVVDAELAQLVQGGEVPQGLLREKIKSAAGCSLKCRPTRDSADPGLFAPVSRVPRRSMGIPWR